jgi:hypothetical protein
MLKSKKTCPQNRLKKGVHAIERPACIVWSPFVGPGGQKGLGMGYAKKNHEILMTNSVSARNVKRQGRKWHCRKRQGAAPSCKWKMH